MLLRFNRLFIRAASDYVGIVEVGPRDGLQNEKSIISTDVKANFIDRLTNAGLPTIEVTAFVSPKWVPQMGDSVAVAQKINRKQGVRYTALVPNKKALEMADEAKITDICVGTAASETFCRKNWNAGIEDTVKMSGLLIKHAPKDSHARGYISNVMGCPYEGDIKQEKVVKLAEMLLDVGCKELSLGDTTGVGTPDKFGKLVKEIIKLAGADMVAVHCHDTYAQALPNVLRALELGVRIVDCSTGGLGGCPYAPGASGNLATEDALYMFHGMGLETGVSLQEVVDAAHFICKELGRPVESKVARAMAAGKEKQ